MRLWHTALIPELSDQRLLGQHRECCALRGKGWGKNHSTVNYVFNHSYDTLFEYHYKVMMEMKLRGMNVTPSWFYRDYRGKLLGTSSPLSYSTGPYGTKYPEHDDKYYAECVELLSARGDSSLRRTIIDKEYIG